MEEIFQRIIDENFSELPGLVVDAYIPVPESLINEIIQTTLLGSRTISRCRVTISRGNQVTADVKSPLLPWTIHLKMKLFGSVDFTSSPKVRAFLENNILLGKLGALLKALPKGINIYDDQVVVDIGSFVTPEQERLLSLVRSVNIKTEEGKVLLDVKIEN
jgi:hypothetical protein